MNDMFGSVFDKIVEAYDQGYKAGKKAAKPRWISVEAMLPEDGADVIAWLEDEHESRMTAANYDHGVWHDCIMHHEEKRVRYWMKKPEPPKEEDDAE